MNQVPFIKSHYTGQTDLKVEGHSVGVLKAMICHYPDLGSITVRVGTLVHKNVPAVSFMVFFPHIFGCCILSLK